MNFAVDCGVNGTLPLAEPLDVSLQANATEDGSPPTTIEFRAIAGGGTPPYKFRWNFDDGGNNDVKSDQLMTHQFARLGQYDVTVAASNSANGHTGQTAYDNIIITIKDIEPPVVSVPPGITVTATGGNGMRVTFSVSAVDNVDGPVSSTCSPYSGYPFQMGTRTVTFSAHDSTGNNATKSFNVTVTPSTCTENQRYDSLEGVCVVDQSNCSDQSDNDGDGLVDSNDPDCPAAPCPENQRYDSIEGVCTSEPSYCDDQSDNDGDGLVDSNDPDCPAAPSLSCDQGQEPVDTNEDGIADECQPIECPEGQELDDGECVEVGGGGPPVVDGGNGSDGGDGGGPPVVDGGNGGGEQVLN
jgi:hypothetical protein